jgi:hypothetical protein
MLAATNCASGTVTSSLYPHLRRGCWRLHGSSRRASCQTSDVHWHHHRPTGAASARSSLCIKSQCGWFLGARLKRARAALLSEIMTNHVRRSAAQHSSACTSHLNRCCRCRRCCERQALRITTPRSPVRAGNEERPRGTPLGIHSSARPIVDGPRVPAAGVWSCLVRDVGD